MPPALSPRLTNYVPDVVVGSTLPRLWTPPLVELTPETSYGFDVIDFARDVLEMPLFPWQEWLVIHAGELLADGRPRFRKVLVLVARQNGKTHLARVLTLYWLFIERHGLILATSTNRNTAKKSWTEVCDIAQANPYLKAELAAKPVRATIGEEALLTAYGCEYGFAAANKRAGRGRTVSRLLLDEICLHDKWDAWDASYHAMNAVPEAQVFAISNQGDENAIVLDSLRESALAYIQTGDGDPRLGLFEYSGPDGCDAADPEGLRQANPAIGCTRGPRIEDLVGEAERVKLRGGQELARFRTEVLCQRVRLMDAAIDPDRWHACRTDTPIKFADHMDKVAMCVDVSARDALHATLMGAALVDGVVHVGVVAQWEGSDCTSQLRADLPGILAKYPPRAFGYLPLSEAAGVVVDLEARKGERSWHPRQTTVVPIRGEDVPAACMGLADLVYVGQLAHRGDNMLTAHVTAAQRKPRGDGWVFDRKNSGPIDATYALAGAVHLARTLPPPRPALVAV